MASSAYAVTGSSSAQKVLFELQVEQHHHDETYHREIARLSLHQRLNHMALHFAKYTGKIASTQDSAMLFSVFVDVAIISLSTANALNVNMYDLLEEDDRDFPGLLAFGRSLATSVQCELDQPFELVRATAIASGRMAAACEKIDHLEEISFREEIRWSLAQLCKFSIAFISSHGNDPAQVIRTRLAEVKKRLKLHGRI